MYVYIYIGIPVSVHGLILVAVALAPHHLVPVLLGEERRRVHPQILPGKLSIIWFRITWFRIKWFRIIRFRILGLTQDRMSCTRKLGQEG